MLLIDFRDSIRLYHLRFSSRKSLKLGKLPPCPQWLRMLLRVLLGAKAVRNSITSIVNLYLWLHTGQAIWLVMAIGNLLIAVMMASFTRLGWFRVKLRGRGTTHR
jgi:hypothetical protein